MKSLLFPIVLVVISPVMAGNSFWEEGTVLSSSSFSTKNAVVVGKKQVINVTGSTTVSNVLNLISDRFEQEHKKIRVNISGGGSSSALTAMLANPKTIGQMSRPMKNKEHKAFIKHYGYKPIELKIAVDALAVYVNKNNPIKRLSKAQLASIFAKNNHNIVNWGDLNLPKLKSPHWQGKLIQVFTLPKFAGAYSLFNKKILNKAGYKVTSISQPTSSSVVQAVGVHSGAITFASSFFNTPRTHFVALEGMGGIFYQPIQPWISTFKYPLSRYLYLYINQKPGTSISKEHRQFLAFLMAEGTQSLIKRAGFYSVAKTIRSKQLRLLK